MATSHRCIRLTAATLLSLGLLFIIVGTVSAHTAHAKVLSSVPAIGSTVAQAPSTVTVFTAENINPDPKKSNLFVYAPSGELISQGNAKVSLSNPREMSIAIKANGNGVYVVRWITVSAEDSDPDQGAFVFTVKPGLTTHPATSNRTTTTTAGTGGTPLWVVILVGVAALVIGLSAGLGIGRSSARPQALSGMRQSVAAQQQEQDATSSKRP